MPYLLNDTNIFGFWLIYRFGTYSLNDFYVEIDRLIWKVLKSSDLSDTKRRNQLIILIERAVYNGLQGN
jgi:hypothetical protein